MKKGKESQKSFDFTKREIYSLEGQAQAEFFNLKRRISDRELFLIRKQ